MNRRNALILGAAASVAVVVRARAQKADFTVLDPYELASNLKKEDFVFRTALDLDTLMGILAWAEARKQPAMTAQAAFQSYTDYATLFRDPRVRDDVIEQITKNKDVAASIMPEKIRGTVERVAQRLTEVGIAAGSELAADLLSSLAVMDQFFIVQTKNESWYCKCYTLQWLCS